MNPTEPMAVRMTTATGITPGTRLLYPEGFRTLTITAVTHHANHDDKPFTVILDTNDPDENGHPTTLVTLATETLPVILDELPTTTAHLADTYPDGALLILAPIAAIDLKHGQSLLTRSGTTATVMDVRGHSHTSDLAVTTVPPSRWLTRTADDVTALPWHWDTLLARIRNL